MVPFYQFVNCNSRDKRSHHRSSQRPRHAWMSLLSCGVVPISPFDRLYPKNVITWKATLLYFACSSQFSQRTCSLCSFLDHSIYPLNVGFCGWPGEQQFNSIARAFSFLELCGSSAVYKSPLRRTYRLFDGLSDRMPDGSDGYLLTLQFSDPPADLLLCSVSPPFPTTTQTIRLRA
ncbi:hypothetical protein BJV78DRAFT_13209 [Lactifluus subvellereus]|nr:hypothetical protein BJV78DRAFT_13209 [Lactifluus subvellereus]